VPPIRVLIVDDSALMRQVLRRILQDAGFDVVGTARDGLEALDRAARLEPDVITLAVEMPRLDGLGALERLMAAGPARVVMFS
jgi:two-component system chemotaxis response regulator CheB